MFIGMRFAITSDMLSESEQGIEHNQDVVAFCREVEDKGCEAGALNGLAFVYLVKLEQPQQAKGYLEQALTIFREIEDLDGQAYTLGNLSETYNQLGQSEQARGCLEQALALYRQTGDVEGEQEILDKLKNLTQSE